MCIFSKLINMIMEKGHKEVARNLVETVRSDYDDT